MGMGMGSGMNPALPAPVHGGPDALGVPLHDFSTNSNACGPCPVALAAVQGADARHYPDPDYTALRGLLGAFHGVAPARIVVAGSASEFIHRATAFALRHGARAVEVPAHSYGDYAQAAQAWGLAVLRRGAGDAEDTAAPAQLQWACEPSSPLGQEDPALLAWRQAPHAALPGAGFAMRVLDGAYRPLQLAGGAGGLGAEPPPGVWQMWTPNKALGLTGVRAAYAVAPPDAAPHTVAALQALAPSWPVGAHGVAMLTAWAGAASQRWLAESLATLRIWKAEQMALCAALGWQVLPGSQANYFVARVPVGDLPGALARLRAQGVKLRDCASFGLPGHVRLGVLPPAAQQALRAAWCA